jgi:4-amino-4-deoxychorismate lyase
MDDGYSLLTSTRYDAFLESCRWNDDDEGPQPFFLLPYHLERLISAAEAHGWLVVRSALTYSVLKTACAEVVSTQRRTGKEGSTAFKVYFVNLNSFSHTEFLVRRFG